MRRKNDIEVRKEQTELASLEAVFISDEYQIVEQSGENRPDFVMVRSGEKNPFALDPLVRERTEALSQKRYPFGVEITDNPESNTHRAVRNRGNYFYQRLLSGEASSFGEKDVIPVVVNILEGPVNTSVEAMIEAAMKLPLNTKNNALLMSIPTPPEHVQKVISAISTKDMKSKKYDKSGLHRLELLIHDYCAWNFPRLLFKGEVVIDASSLFTPEMSQALASSEFSEIYLVAENERKHLRLQALFITYEASLFSKFLSDHPSCTKLTPTEKLSLFSHVMKMKYGATVEIGKKNGKSLRGLKAAPRILYRNYSLSFVNDMRETQVRLRYGVHVVKTIPKSRLKKRLRTSISKLIREYYELRERGVYMTANMHNDWGTRHFDQRGVMTKQNKTRRRRQKRR